MKDELKDEDILTIDFQGWPVYRMNLREILKALGAEFNGEYWMIPESSLLDVYPRTLEDDGMGYGVNEKYISEVSIGENQDYINMFIEAKQEND